MKIRDITEMASAGGCSSGSVASVAAPLGGTQRRSKKNNKGGVYEDGSEQRETTPERDGWDIVDEKNGYVLGVSSHDDRDVSKADYDVYKFVRTHKFKWKGTTYEQDMYHVVGSLDISPYAKSNEVGAAWKEFLVKAPKNG